MYASKLLPHIPHCMSLGCFRMLQACIQEQTRLQSLLLSAKRHRPLLLCASILDASCHERIPFYRVPPIPFRMVYTQQRFRTVSGPPRPKCQVGKNTHAQRKGLRSHRVRMLYFVVIHSSRESGGICWRSPSSPSAKAGKFPNKW